MSKLLPLLFLGYGLISLTLGQSDEACPVPAGTQSTCVCQTDSGRIIDLRPLAKKDGTARFTFKNSYYSYNYNPCIPFSDGSKCPNIFICQHAIDNDAAFTLANQDEQIFKDSSSGKFYVHYAGPPNQQRQTKVYLNCDQCNRGGTVTSIVQPDDSDYVIILQLSSCHACPGGCRYDTSGCGPQSDVL